MFCVIRYKNDEAAQKKPLDHDVYDSWQSVSGLTLSDDGSAMIWSVNPQEGDGTLFVRKYAGKKAGKSSRP